MDHRLGQRVNVALPVQLRFQDRPSQSGVAVNVGRGGMFIETLACDHEHGNGCVDIQLAIEMPDGGQIIRLSAFVVHRRGSGLGLMFRELDASTWQPIGNLLSQLD
ncbi:PilZ domain-containing protein [uncultured Thiocystis sp.]|jgi:hypothetical protein|uniref:PilZ domain-containing protein n=1 Tax=uncultured Thiocystis sp. TaxID=1202134 RepID=UPI0025EBF279|nr:PilZ domain-containing protein [uncultured Thiocystis sp.]